MHVVGTGAASGCTSPPMPTSAAAMSTWMSNVMSQYSGFTSVNNGGQWLEYFEVANYAGCTNQFPATFNGAANPSQMVTTGTNGLPVDQFTYTYQLCVIGKGAGTQVVHTTETASFTISVNAQASSTKATTESFAAFGAFINNFTECQGPLVPGTITGPQIHQRIVELWLGSYIFTIRWASPWAILVRINNNCTTWRLLAMARAPRR